MNLVVLDTNVVISAAIGSQTAPAVVLHEWVLAGLVQTVTTPAIVQEYRAVARREKFRRYNFPPLWLEFLIEESLALPAPAPWPLPVPDKGDAPFLAAARAAGAWLVTGNLKHFPAASRGSVRVISPSEYLEHLRTSG